LGLGDYESAIRLFQKVKQLQPDDSSLDADIQNANSVKYFNESSQSAYDAKDFRKVIYFK
jgi:hypothetical protein